MFKLRDFRGQQLFEFIQRKAMRKITAAILICMVSDPCSGFSVAAGGTQRAVVASTLSELAFYARLDNVAVSMEPGVYEIRDTSLLTNAVVETASDDGSAAAQYSISTFLHFSGDRSVYDLEGVILNFDTAVHNEISKAVDKVLISGNGNIIKGLELKDIGTTSPRVAGMRMLHVIGDTNTISNVNLFVSGSSPYGYGNLLGKGGGASVPLRKNSAFLITGRDNNILSCRVVSRAFGHGIVMQGAVNTLIKDCYVEGEMRATDEMLRETSGAAFDLEFKSMYPPGHIVPGRKISLNEDGVRTYARGNQVGGRRTRGVTVINTTVKNMRSGFALAGEEDVIISGCTSIGHCEKGFAAGSGTIIKNSRGDAANGPLLAIWEKGSRKSFIELEIIDTIGEFQPARLAEINGRGHQITISNYQGKPRLEALPIVFGESFWQDVNSWRNPEIAPSTGAEEVRLENYTGMPVVLRGHISNCIIITNGPVEDEGTNNTIEAAKPHSSDVIKKSSPLWNNAAVGDNTFMNPDNWDEGALPGSGDVAYIDLAGDDKAVFDAGSHLIQVLRVGAAGTAGELDITGGSLTANSTTSTHRSRIGSGAGRTGTVNQSGGVLNIRHPASIGFSGGRGIYNLSRGEFLVSNHASPTWDSTKRISLEIGNAGDGLLNITGGRFTTRAGVDVQSLGVFCVAGSGSTSIDIGRNSTVSGYWNQAAGGRLQAQVDAGGLTTIKVWYKDNLVGQAGDVAFANGALLDVSFLGGSDRAGSWDVMTWSGTLTDNGLAFAPGVDAEIWSFAFIDTNGSGFPDTLRVTAK